MKNCTYISRLLVFYFALLSLSQWNPLYGTVYSGECSTIITHHYQTADVFADSASVDSLSTLPLQPKVTIGYLKLRKDALTGAITNLDSDDLNPGLISDPALVLQGKVPGLTVNKRGADPNEFSILHLRGLSTFMGNPSPLIVIDGMPGSALLNIDPNDIDQVTILRDASASALYGMRGANGVVLITSRSGEDNLNKMKSVIMDRWVFPVWNV